MKHLKKLETFSPFNKGTFKNIGSKLHNAGAILTGKPTIWEKNMYKSRFLTKKVVDILISRGYNLTDESGTMTDGADVWAINRDGKQPIVLSPIHHEYEKKSEIQICFYFPSKEFEDIEEYIEVDESNLEQTADKVSKAIDKLKSLNHNGNVLSRQGQIKLI